MGHNMVKSKSEVPKKFIIPLYVNRLHGRMLRLPPRKTGSSEILIVYGLQSSLDQVYNLAKQLNSLGGVTVVDLPGFGGMNSFYKIGEKPSTDRFADYLAALIKLKFSRKKLNIVGVSYGFAVTVRMLQKYPELASKVFTLVSVEGYVHSEDFNLKSGDILLFRSVTKILSLKFPAWLADKLILRPSIMKFTYNIALQPKAISDSKKHSIERKSGADSKIRLWKQNDLRTYMATSADILKLNLCDQQIDLVVYQIFDRNKNRFKEDVLEQHLKVIFKKAYIFKSNNTVKRNSNKHHDYVIPTKIRRQLSR